VDWTDFDHSHVWHPYAPLIDAAPVYPVVAANGVELTLEDGRRLVDGMASWWCAIHGYNHPVLNRALREQSERFSHVMFGGLTHRPATDLARRLLELCPGNLQGVFFADSGSVSVEVAIKMAVQYWHGRGQAGKKRLLTPRHGYHGDTFGAMSVCDPVNGMHRLFQGIVTEQLFVPPPKPGDRVDNDEDIDAVATALAQHHHELAAMILEPIVQGAGGMRIYRPDYLRQVARLCREYGVLLIVDEIATGFGRTGTLFACEQAAVEPDILCLGKALTGGMMTLAATLVSSEVADGIEAGKPGVLMHGPTFMANPLACAVALASIDLLLTQDWQARVQTIEAGLEAGLAPCRDLSCVADVRIKGAIGVVELKDPGDLQGIQEELVDLGVWLRPFRNLVYTMPPFIIEPGQLDRIAAAIRQVLGRRAR
jgi:adenosylmethionine-8-amino-7-oxononanoate aminotransferase